jgi:hypothetical protein
MGYLFIILASFLSIANVNAWFIVPALIIKMMYWMGFVLVILRGFYKLSLLSAVSRK